MVGSKGIKKVSAPPCPPAPASPPPSKKAGGVAAQRPQTGRVVASWLFPVYLLIIFMGYLVMHGPGAMNSGNEMGSDQALFTSVNAATLTGFAQTYDLNQFRPLGQATVFVLMLSGSMLSLVIGGLAAVRVLRLPYSDRRVVRAAVIAQVAAMGIGGMVLLVDTQRTVCEAGFMAASAFGNCGLVLGTLPGATEWLTPVVLLPLITLGGFGLPVLMELYDLLFHRRRMSLHSRVVLTITGWLFVIGTLALTCARWSEGAMWKYDLVTSAATVVDARTCGFGFISLRSPGPGVFWILVALMSIGGASAGTAGGIKITTLAEIGRQIGRLFRGKPVSRSLWIGACWVVGFAALVGVTIWLQYVFPEEAHPEARIFKAFSAVSNCGSVFEVIQKERAQFYILSAAMLAGRLCSLSVLWWLADTTKDAEIAVG
jgi:trk system potassium uptake protein TrkH